ncbi:EF-hand domain-containing protein [Akkermansia biwaensis]
MKKNILLAMAFAIAAPCAFAQDEAPATPPPGDAPRHHEGRQGKRPQRPGMNPEQMGMFIIGEQLVLEQYDTDKDGKLSDEEKAAVKAEIDKRMKARRDEMMKKYDKDGDGKLSREERQSMRDGWAKAHPEAVKKMEERRAEMMKKYDKDGDGKLSDEEKKVRAEDWKNSRDQRPGMGEGRRGPRGGEGRPGSPNGPRRGGAMDPVMMLGHDLIMEKYDTDKDGILSDSEKEALKADVKKAIQAKRAERKAKGDQGERGKRGGRRGHHPHPGNDAPPVPGDDAPGSDE